MKKMIFTLVLFVAALPFLANSQTRSSDFQKGTIVTASNDILEGNIRDLTKNKGTIVFESSAGRKKIYTAAELAGFSQNGTSYVSYANDFYKVAVTGSKAALYQRVTDNSGKMLYNGAEVVLATTAEGKPGDWYIETKSNNKWIRVTQKDFEAALTTSFADCASVIADVKGKQIDFAQIAKAVEKYNSCH